MPMVTSLWSRISILARSSRFDLSKARANGRGSKDSLTLTLPLRPSSPPSPVHTILAADGKARFRFHDSDAPPGLLTAGWPGVQSPGCAAALLDHLIRPQQQRRRDREAERLGGLHVDDQLEFRRLLDGEIGGLGALQDLVDVHSSAGGDILEVRAVRH